jgi:hypothetical protein
MGGKKQIAATVLLAFLLSTALADDAWLVDIPQQRDLVDDTVHSDVMAFSVEKPFTSAHGRPTQVHETAHGIHATYRNEFKRKLGKKVNAFYMLKGKIAVVDEPDFLICNVQKHVPVSLRGYRYKLYFVDQLRDWDDTPLYVLDEWTAYICGGESAVSDFQTRGIKDEFDSVSGCLEFSIYAVSTYLTAKERVPDYVASHPQFRSVLRHNLRRAEDAYEAGRSLFYSSKSESLHDNLQHCDDAEPVRKCLRDEFGGCFLKRRK